MDTIDTAGKDLGLTQADAWPTLRSHLMLFAANGRDPEAILADAVALGGLETARDPAAVIDYRLDLTHANLRPHGPLPWLPGIPTQLLHNPEWKTYLSARYVLTRELAEQTIQTVQGETPGWARHLPGLDPNLLDDIQLWRAAHNTPDTDLRPTGPTRYSPVERHTQRDLTDRLEAAHAGIREWTPRILEAVPGLAGDPRLPVLAAKLNTLATTGYDALRILHAAAAIDGLPDDHPADALGYRITKLVAREPAPARWETYKPSKRDRPERSEPPPSLGHPTRGPSISF